MRDVKHLSELAERMLLPRSIRESHSHLKACVRRLTFAGETALGPALLMSVKLAGRVPWSRVILVTDGRSNVGLGCLDGSQEGFEDPAFYPFVGNIAKELGVVVNVIAIKGISYN